MDARRSSSSPARQASARRASCARSPTAPARRAARVLEGGCVQVGTEGLPFGPLIEALRGLAYELPPAELDELLGSGPGGARPPDAAAAARSGRVPAAAAAGQFGAGPAVRARPAPASSGSRRGRRCSSSSEDVHWADRSTLELLGFLGRNLRQAPIVLVASYRSDELDRRHPLAAIPRRAGAHRPRRTARAQALRRPELAAQLPAILGAATRPGPRRAHPARSKGNAFYAEELLAAGTHRPPSGDPARGPAGPRRDAERADTGVVRLASAGGTRIRRRCWQASRGPTIATSMPRSARRWPGTCSSQDGAAEERNTPSATPSSRRRSTASCFPANGPGSTPRSRGHWQRAQPHARRVPGGRARLSLAGGARSAARIRAWISAGIAAEALYAFAEARGGLRTGARTLGPDPGRSRPRPARPGRTPDARRIPRRRPGPGPLGGLYPGSHRACRRRRPTRRERLLHERLGQYSSTRHGRPDRPRRYRRPSGSCPRNHRPPPARWVLSGLGRFYADTDRPVEAVAVCEEGYRSREPRARGTSRPGRWCHSGVAAALGEVETGLDTLGSARDAGGRPRRCPRGRRAHGPRSPVRCAYVPLGGGGGRRRRGGAYARAMALRARWAPLALMCGCPGALPAGALGRGRGGH